MDFINPLLNAVTAGNLIFAGLAILVSLTPTDKDDSVVGRAQNLWAKFTGPLVNFFKPRSPLDK